VAREPDGLVVAEPERCVISSVELNRTDLELRPLWELLGDEAGDDLGGGICSGGERAERAMIHH
jgi:hypothetical protein